MSGELTGGWQVADHETRSCVHTWPRVCAIVLSWNNVSDTLVCLRSLLGVEYPNLEVLVVDNASGDGTVEAVRERYPQVAIIQNSENLGYAEGNNVGIRRALDDGAEYVLLLNNDTIVEPALLTELIKAAESAPQVGVVGPVIYYYDRPATIWSAGSIIDWRRGTLRRLRAEEADHEAASLQRPYPVDYVSGCALCIKRQVIEAVGLLDPRYFLCFEETDWCMRAHTAGYVTLVVPTAHIWHKVSATMRQDSPTTTYYMTRNSFLFLASHLYGLRRATTLSHVLLRELRTLAAHSLKPRYRYLRRNRDARLLALRDAVLGRWGQMGPDVAAVCRSVG